ncbi:MAG: YncE family protein [Bryobacteraceae bacterium]
MKPIVGAALVLLSHLVSAPAQGRERIVQQGVAVEFDLRPVANGTAVATIRVLDEASGTPIDGSRPKVWLSKRRNEAVAIETPCLEKIRNFASGQLTARADVDLNSYLLATLNHDRTVTFLNPFVSAVSKLEAAVELKGVGFDWVYSPELERLFVSMPDASAIAVIDAVTLKLLGNVELPTGSKPGRVVLSPDGSSVWSSLDGFGQIAVIDGAGLTVKGYVPVGKGMHQIVFSPPHHRTYITNSEDDNVTAVNAETLKKIEDIPVERTPVAAAWVPAAKLIYVGSVNSSRVAAIDPDTNKVVSRIAAGPGIVWLQADPGGRFALAISQAEGKVFMIDSSVAQVVGTAGVESEPDQAAFTERYAYVHALDSNSFAVINLAELREGHATPVYIQTGDAKLSQEPNLIAAAPAVVATPEGNSVLAANGPEAVLYFLEEGMMAPKGTLQNYRRKPRGVMVIDRGLRSIGKGVYQATLRVPSSGRFDVPFALDEPKVRVCFEASLIGDPAPDRKAAVQLRAVMQNQRETAMLGLTPSEPREFQFRIQDAVSGQPVLGLRGVQLLAFEPPGQWQSREWLIERGDGIYAATHQFPHAGKFVLQVVAVRRDFSLEAHPATVQVRNGK